MQLTQYLPDISTLPAAQILAMRQRLQSDLATQWPALDTRPNSVFGDFHLTPLAVLMQMVDQSMGNFKSDLDLTNVAAGTIYDEAFVRAFLRNFGVSAQGGVYASGVLRLTFSANQAVPISSAIVFTLGQYSFSLLTPNAAVLVQPTTAVNATPMLTQVGNGRYEVYLPIIGAPGATVSDGTVATLDQTLPNFVEAVVVGDIDSGTVADDLPALAAKAQMQFVASSLSSRAGIISYVTKRWPNLIAVSATVTGDREMLRGGTNPLGIKTGAVDVFIKSSKNYLSASAQLTLTYNTNKLAWVGRLALPVIPAALDYASGIFQVDQFQNGQGAFKLYAKSQHPTLDGLGISYSKHEVLGIEISDATPGNYRSGALSLVKSRYRSNLSLNVFGEYGGNVFSAYGRRQIRLRLVAVDGLRLEAHVLDEVTGESAVVHFDPDSDASPALGLIDKSEVGYQQMFNGLELQLVPSGGYTPATSIGQEYSFEFTGRTADFTLNYFYDPYLVLADYVTQNGDQRPVNVDLLARNFIVCQISTFVVHYRSNPGAQFNAAVARQAIADYLNTLTYPAQYEEAKVAAIVLGNGAIGVKSILKQGRFFPSIASVYVDAAGQESVIEHPLTSSLLPVTNDLGFSARNVTYVIQPSAIEFSGTVT